MRRLRLHAGLWIDVMIHAVCNPNQQACIDSQVYVDSGGMYGWTRIPVPAHAHQRGPLGHDDVHNRLMRLEAENVYQRERIGRLEAERDRRKRYHKFHVARSWGSCGRNG